MKAEEVVNTPGRCVQMIEEFEMRGENGDHKCIVMELLGENLLKLLARSKYKGIPVSNVKSVIKQVLEGLHHLHTKSRLMHTDIKPENVC